MIDRATIDKIMDATNIVDVVSEFVTLRKAGVNYKGLCPFHDDTTPSFMVSPSKQICKCFACGEGGTAINFLMKHEQITYPEALRWLAKKYSIDIQEKELTDEEKQQQSDRESMFIVNEWAMNYFHDILKNDPDGVAIGRQYFRSRGIRDDIIEKFSLGYALPQRDALAKAAQKAGYKAEFLVKTGVCIQGEKGIYDRYAGRVIFPWLNVSGKVVAFGGRLLDSRTKGLPVGSVLRDLLCPLADIADTVGKNAAVPECTLADIFFRRFAVRLFLKGKNPADGISALGDHIAEQLRGMIRLHAHENQIRLRTFRLL